MADFDRHHSIYLLNTVDSGILSMISINEIISLIIPLFLSKVLISSFQESAMSLISCITSFFCALFGFGMNFLLLQGVMKDILKHSSSRVALGLAFPTVVGQHCDISSSIN